jgi:hypothetical protein
MAWKQRIAAFTVNPEKWRLGTDGLKRHQRGQGIRGVVRRSLASCSIVGAERAITDSLVPMTLSIWLITRTARSECPLHSSRQYVNAQAKFRPPDTQEIPRRDEAFFESPVTGSGAGRAHLPLGAALYAAARVRAP